MYGSIALSSRTGKRGKGKPDVRYDPDDAAARDIARIGQMLAHPLRVYLIRCALQEDEVSTVELAKRDGAPRGPLAYHCRVLTDLGALKVVRTDQHRGVYANFYGIEPDRAAALRKVLRVLDGAAAKPG